MPIPLAISFNVLKAIYIHSNDYHHNINSFDQARRVILARFQQRQQVVMLTLERGSLVCPLRNVMRLTVLQLSLCNLHVLVYTSFYFLEALQSLTYMVMILYLTSFWILGNGKYNLQFLVWNLLEKWTISNPQCGTYQKSVQTPILSVKPIRKVYNLQSLV